MAFTLNNEFLDKLRLSESHIYLKSLRTYGAGFSDRAELSKILGISSETIRRYESNWKNSNPPQWYELLLRFLCGDLSYYGDYWHQCRIHPKTCKLSTPFDKYNAYLPRELHMSFNRIHQLKERELHALQQQLKVLETTIQELEIQLNAYQSENAKLTIKLEQANATITRIRNYNHAIETGKVIELSSRR